MQNDANPLALSVSRVDRLRLRSFTMLRWVAVVGQISAILITQYYYKLNFDSGLVYVAVAASALANLFFQFFYPENKRLTQFQVLAMLLFDLLQLSFLIYLTGGLNNPFALLILVPVTIAATALNTRSTIFIGLVTLLSATLLANFNVPLRAEYAFIVAMPKVFVFGFWVAIVIGTVFLAGYARLVSSEIQTMSQALLATQMALSREQSLTDLGGVVAAAAHELGTPLATIKLTSTELVDELEDNKTLRDDALLIRDQADRCREILRSMGKAGKDDRYLRTAPLSALLSEAAEPHIDRGVSVVIDLRAEASNEPEPAVFRQPEIIHGLRNLIQNAVDFAAATVWVEARWSEDFLRLRIVDDGPGYPPNTIGRIGDPVIRNRRSAADRAKRPGYEGMGMGLFIAKTLLERTRAELTFANGSAPLTSESGELKKCGAVVTVVWKRQHIGPDAREKRAPLGQNEQIIG